MKSPLLKIETLAAIEQKCLELLNRQEEFLTKHTIKSTRAAGDAIQSIIEEGFEAILGEHGCSYEKSTSRKSFGDLSFDDNAGNRIAVDVKTHREDADFSMPNLKSVDRLVEFYESDTNILFLLIFHYSIKDYKVIVSKVRFFPIEYADWNCLQIAALGLGQIQFRDANKISIKPEQSRVSWMQRFCDEAILFYPKQITKSTELLEKFKEAKQRWSTK
jgi:hypothetical protein